MNAEPSADFVAKEAIDIEAILGLSGVGAFLIWFGIQALDPAWSVDSGRGLKIINLIKTALASLADYPTVRGSIIIAVGALSLLLGLFLALQSIFWREPRLIVDANGIECFDEEGKGRLAWNDIASVRVIDDVLRVSGRGGSDISVKTKEIDKSVKEVFAAIGRYRPDVLPADPPRPATA